MVNWETDGFLDNCDTPPPEFWICFENRILYSFIPTEFEFLVQKAIDIVILGGLNWVTGTIYILNKK